jgi:hypothetical protein
MYPPSPPPWRIRAASDAPLVAPPLPRLGAIFSRRAAPPLAPPRRMYHQRAHNL